MVFTTEELFEVAIESWPEWDLNPQPLNSVLNNSPSESILYSYSKLLFYLVAPFL